jgi:hypothetical protein
LKTNKFYPGRLSVVILIIILFSSCTKKPDQVGLSLQPVSAELSVVFDNSSGLLVHSVREDSVRTDVNVIKTGMLGSLLDPEFGKTTAEIFSQFRLSENGHDFGTDPVVDSMVLSLSYSGFYGDSMATQTVKIYEIDQDMVDDTSYYSNQTISDNGVEIGNLTFVPALNDSVNVGGEMKAPQLRITLLDDFAQRIISADEAVFVDNTAWLEYMKGFRITSEPTVSGGGIMQFDMFDLNTVLTIYYRSGTPEDTLSFTFLSNSSCARFSGYEHYDYAEASSELRVQILDGDTTGGADMFYLQSMGGVKAQIRLPDIQSFFADGPVAINEAKLVLNLYDDGNDLGPPPQLALAMIDEDGEYITIPDFTEAGTYYGGYLNEGETQYFFRISRFVQQVLTGQSRNYPLALLISGASFRANRVILFGPEATSNPEMKMRLEVTYTKVN